jgi:PAS domain-containing protein
LGRRSGVIELRRAAAVVLLFLGVGMCLHLLLNPMSESGQSAAVKTVVLGTGLFLALLGVIGGYLIARMPKERINVVAERLENLVRQGTIGLVISEGETDSLGRLGQAVNRYLTFIKDEVEQSRMTAKERQIQMKVLEAEKRHVEAVIHAISDGVIVTEAFGDLVLANGAAENIFGFHFDAAVRKPADEVIGDSKFLALLTEMRETGLHVPHRTVEIGRAHV